VIALLLLSAADPLASGVPVGKRPGPYSFLVATGPERGRQTCFICDQAAKPACVVFARTLTPELGALLAGLDAEAGRRTDGFKAWLTVLGDTDLDKLAKWAHEQGLKRVAVGGFARPAGPPAYALHPDAAVTALVFANERVTANVAAREWTAADTAAVLKAAAAR
jgi:hypothetical protein